jgi:hypothetical protein
MNRLTVIATILTLGLMTGAAFARPQDASKTPSLGDLAKKLRAERGEQAPKPAKVYTNDNIPRTGALSEVGAAGEAAGAAKSQGNTAAAGEAKNGSQEKSASGAHDEKYYREKMQELQSQKEMHQRELDVLNQKLSLNQTQYYSDPNKTLNQEYSRSDITKKQDEIEKKKQQIANDQKAIEDLEAQCQREGCPAGWLR